MFVESADGGVAKENASAAVGLEAMFVRIDDDGVGVREGVEGGASFGGEVRGECEVATVGRVDMDAEFVFLSESDNLIERIDGTDSRCA